MSENLFRYGRMKSFKAKLLSAWAFAAPAISAVLPRDNSIARVGHRSVVTLDLQKDYAQATFSVPCAGCLGGDDDAHEDDESLFLNFKTHASDEPCGTSPNITLNGLDLTQQWTDNSAAGVHKIWSTGAYKSYATGALVDVDWTTTCLYPNDTTNSEEASELRRATDHSAQLLTLSIRAVNGKRVRKPTGFTISFNQNNPPELLRFEPAPFFSTPFYSSSARLNAEAWRAPPPDLRISAPSDSTLSPTSEAPHAHHSQELQELEDLYSQAEAIHKAIVDKENRLGKAEFADCKGITCVCKGFYRVLRHKPQTAWRLGLEYIGLSSQTPVMGRPENESDPAPAASPAASVRPVDSNKDSDLPDYNSLPSGPPPPYQAYTTSHKNNGNKQRNQFLAIALGLLGTVLCCGCIVVTVKHHCATREKCKKLNELKRTDSYPTKRLTRKGRWRQWLHRRTEQDQVRIDDYDEKRRLIQEQESVLESAVQDEIRQLREAHGFVNALVEETEAARVPRTMRIGTDVRVPIPQHFHHHHHQHRQPNGCCPHHMPRPVIAPQPVPAPIRTPSPTPSTASRTGHCPHHRIHHCQHQHHAHNHAHNHNSNNYPSPPSPSSPAPSYPASNYFPSRPPSRSSTFSIFSLLPSYSDSADASPPAYTSDDDSSGSSGMAHHFRHYNYRPRGSSIGSDSNDSRWTPDSSIVDVSPRRSAETLRTVYAGGEMSDVEI